VTSPVGNISDTARWVAVYRAMETERPDAIFRDPWARELAGARGEEILRKLRDARSSSWAFVVRTIAIDELLRKAISESGVDTVLNLAAGLDARPYRLPLPPTLRWIDVDLPGILSYKKEKLAAARPVCTYEAVALDLSDLPARRELFRRVGAGGKNVLTVTEGLLVYLTAEEVGSLATDLHAQPTFARWIIDIASRELLKILQKSYGKELSSAGAPLKFAPAENTKFFLPYGWKTTEFRSSLEEARRVHREMRMAWIFHLLALVSSEKKREKYRRMAGIALLERA
jgi:methyltransferase (TIGR00027 family)